MLLSARFFDQLTQAMRRNICRLLHLTHSPRLDVPGRGIPVISNSPQIQAPTGSPRSVGTAGHSKR